MQIQIRITDINTNKTVNVCGKCTCTCTYVIKYSVTSTVLKNLQINMRKSADRDSNAVHHDFMLSNPKSKNTS